MRKTIAELEQRLAVRNIELQRVCDASESQRKSLHAAEKRATELERELKNLSDRLEQQQLVVDSRSREEGRLDGYRQRVREEDAKALGKLWHEAKDPSHSSIPWGTQ